MNKIHLLFLYIVFIGLSCFCFYGCNGKFERKNMLKNQIKYEYERKMITYDYGNGSTMDVELYIDKLNDTISNQVFAYTDKVLDSSKSLFYTLSLEKIKNSDEYKGKIKYHFNPNKEGNLVGFNFNVISKTDEKTEFLSFDNNDIVKNQLEFKFRNNSDTLVGHIFAQHLMDTIVLGEDKLRFREVFISVDNYTKTNNPFTKGLR